MSELRTGQRALLVSLVSVWIVCFGLHVREALRGGVAQTPFIVRAADDADGYPLVVRVRPGAKQGSAAIPGDRVVAVGAADLKGASPWVVYAQLAANVDVEGWIEVRYARAGRTTTVRERLDLDSGMWRDAGLALAFAATALLILLRAPGSPMGQAFSWGVLVWTLTLLRFPSPLPEQTYAYFAVRIIAGTLWAPLMVFAAYRFPENAWPPDRPLPRWPWLFVGLGLTWTSKWAGMPFSVEFGTRANPAVGTAALAAMLFVATRNYARADALGRRQARWVLLGVYVGFVPTVLGNLVAVAQPDLAWIWYAAQTALLAIPISIFIAVSRSNLLDIDRLISSTASYTILLIVLGACALVGVPWVAEVASERAGIDRVVVQIAMAIVVAVAAVRIEPTLRPYIERIFFSERQDLQAGVDRLVTELAEAPDATSMASMIGERLHALLRPSSCVIYARSDDGFAPVFARGSTVTPEFDFESPLMESLGERTQAVDLDFRNNALKEASPADLAALGSLAAAILLPVTRENELAAVVVLGRKRSGDVYTPTDLALLSLVSARASSSLMRFDGEELLRQARSLQGRLRQYVPASIAAQLVAGRSLEDGEREVSVLFADLRGYTSLAEGRRADEIFSIVSRYTEQVSQVVTVNGGTVVEFNGDGMMAVFGAPEMLPEKERCAIEAAVQIVRDVRDLGAALGGLEVGVGVATGQAYVGAIRSVDRYIWSAIGNTTNLAARLQALTKDLGASVVVDDATCRAASAVASTLTADFAPSPRVAIRGLRQPQDLWIREAGAGASPG